MVSSAGGVNRSLLCATASVEELILIKNAWLFPDFLQKSVFETLYPVSVDQWSNGPRGTCLPWRDGVFVAEVDAVGFSGLDSDESVLEYSKCWTIHFVNIHWNLLTVHFWFPPSVYMCGSCGKVLDYMVILCSCEAMVPWGPSVIYLLYRVCLPVSSFHCQVSLVFVIVLCSCH